MNKSSICNAALIALGADKIMNIGEDTEQARVCNSVFDDVLDEVLVAHPWNCSLAKRSLAQSSVAPVFGYSYSYALPTNPYCLRVIRLNEADFLPGSSVAYGWKIAGRFLETDSETANIEFIKRITDLGELTPALGGVVAARLAAEIAYRITANATIRETMWKVYSGKLTEAIQKDAVEGKEEPTPEDPWLTARA
jgi:hypothetical protein